MATPKKNAIFIFYVSLTDSASRPAFKANPTIATGDFQVSTDGGAFGNLTTLPTVTPASGVAVKISLSATEMNGDQITVKCIDAAGSEWDDLFVSITTETSTIGDIKDETALILDDTDLIDDATSGLAKIATDTAAVLVDTNELQVDWVDGGRLDALLDLVATTADLLDKVGAVSESAATGDPSSTESVIQYVKQIVNILIGTDGVTTYPAEAAPGNAVSLAEILSAIHADVTGLAGSAMRGTDNAALASVATEARLAELDAANLPTDLDAVLVDTGTTLPALLPSTLVGGRIDANVGAIGADADVPARLVDSLSTLQKFTIDGVTFTPTITQVQVDAVTPGSLEITDDHYNGRVIIFLDGGLIYQAATITDYDGTNKRFTYDTLTEAPSDNGTFLVI
jgi:hypothetical protein